MYAQYNGTPAPESPTEETKLQYTNGYLHVKNGDLHVKKNGVVRYKNGGLHQQNGGLHEENGILHQQNGTSHLYQKNPSTPQLTPRLPHKRRMAPDETSAASAEYQGIVSDHASTYIMLEPDVVDPQDPRYPRRELEFRTSGIVICGYESEEADSEETGSM